MILSLFLELNIFQNQVTSKYDGTDATIEIIAMLTIATLLGFLLRHFLGYMSKKEIILDGKNATINSESNFSYDNSNTINDNNLMAELNSIKAENIKLKADLNAQIGNNSKSSESKIISKTADPIIEANVSNLSKAKTTSKTAKKTEPKAQIKKDITPVEEKKAVPTKTTKTSKTAAPTKKIIANKRDDLKIIEGIGPAIEKLLNANGIENFNQLATEKVANLERILDEAGPRFRVHVPETWTDQAKLLNDGKIEAFNKLTEQLKGGRRK